MIFNVKINRVNARHTERVSVIADVRYNREKGYSRKYTTGYLANTRNKYRNTQCDYIKGFILFFYFKQFSNYQTFLVPKISKNSQLYTV
jgi:hypothetical protein